MNPFDISEFSDELTQGALEALKKAGIESLKEAADDALAFVEASIPKLQRYGSLYLTGQINKEEFESLMLGLRDLAQLNGLTQAGLAQIKIEEAKNGLLTAVSSIALGIIHRI